MSKLLVPIDGSPCAQRALQHALAAGRDLVLVNVQPKADAPALLLHMTPEQIEQVQRDHGRTMIEPAIAEAGSRGARFTHQVLIGEPAECITRLAQAEGVDGIVMGTRGMGPWGNLVLGSTATKVVHLAEVPVTLVK